MAVAVTVGVIVGLLLLLAFGRVSPAGGIMGATTVLVLTGVVAPEDGFAGFSNPAVVTIAALYVVADAVRRTGVLDAAVRWVLAVGRGQRRVLLRLLAPVAAASAVLNNTPIVAATAPVVYARAVRQRQSASRYLMPLSYATILGGVITTIGTSTNLVVSGLLEQRGLPPFGLFAMTPIGLPLAVVGVVMIVVTAPRLLPDRPTPGDVPAGLARRYAATFAVQPGGPVDGARIVDAGLRHLPDGFLAAVERRGRVRVAGADEVLRGGDVLTFVGDGTELAAVLDTVGLTATQQLALDGDAARRGARLVEAVIGAESPLVGRTLADVQFRGRYGAAVLAIHRDGGPVEGKLGTVELRPGDALLVLGDADFAPRWEGREDFALLAGTADDSARQVSPRGRLAVIAVGLMIVAAAAGIVPILQASLAAVLLLVLTRTITVSQARDAIDLDVLLVVAGSFSLAAAMDSSGLTGRMADAAAGAAAVGGRVGGVIAVVVATMLLTEPLSNAAAAALMLPVALDVAARLDGDPVVFAAGVAIAASASFLTPIGYQTNTMIYGLGGYRFSDYARLGAPLTLLSLIAVSTGVLALAW